jgi:hypothetical protein
MPSAIPQQLDHLIFATPDLQASVADLNRRFGVSFLPGGAHPAWGTRNAVLPLSSRTYLEIVGPDPDARSAPQLFEIGRLAAGRLFTWAAKGTDLPRLVARARERGLDLGDAIQGTRLRPDGTHLTWTLTDPFRPRAQGIVPFFIDWPGTDHPATLRHAEIELVELSAEHPEPERVSTDLKWLGIELNLKLGQLPRLRATFRAPTGVVELC